MTSRYVQPQIVREGKGDLDLPAVREGHLRSGELEFIFSFTFYLERRNNVIFHTVTEQREPSLLQNLQS